MLVEQFEGFLWINCILFLFFVFVCLFVCLFVFIFENWSPFTLIAWKITAKTFSC